MRRSLWVRFLALLGLQPRRRRFYRRTRTYVAIGPATDWPPRWIPQDAGAVRIMHPDADESAWLVRSKRTAGELCTHAELVLGGGASVVVLEVTHRWACLHADNVVRWLEAR